MKSQHSSNSDDVENVPLKPKLRVPRFLRYLLSIPFLAFKLGYHLGGHVIAKKYYGKEYDTTHSRSSNFIGKCVGFGFGFLAFAALAFITLATPILIIKYNAAIAIAQSIPQTAGLASIIGTKFYLGVSIYTAANLAMLNVFVHLLHNTFYKNAKQRGYNKEGAAFVAASPTEVEAVKRHRKKRTLSQTNGLRVSVWESKYDEPGPKPVERQRTKDFIERIVEDIGGSAPSTPVTTPRSSTAAPLSPRSDACSTSFIQHTTTAVAVVSQSLVTPSPSPEDAEKSRKKELRKQTLKKNGAGIGVQFNVGNSIFSAGEEGPGLPLANSNMEKVGEDRTITPLSPMTSGTYQSIR